MDERPRAVVAAELVGDLDRARLRAVEVVEQRRRRPARRSWSRTITRKRVSGSLPCARPGGGRAQRIGVGVADRRHEVDPRRAREPGLAAERQAQAQHRRLAHVGERDERHAGLEAVRQRRVEAGDLRRRSAVRRRGRSGTCAGRRGAARAARRQRIVVGRGPGTGRRRAGDGAGRQRDGRGARRGGRSSGSPGRPNMKPSVGPSWSFSYTLMAPQPPCVTASSLGVRRTPYASSSAPGSAAITPKG